MAVRDNLYYRMRDRFLTTWLLMLGRVTQGAMAAGPVLIIALLPAKPSLAADPADILVGGQAGDGVILECSAGALDDQSIVECVTLKLEQSEAALQLLEQRWQQLLETLATAADDEAPVAAQVTNDELTSTDRDESADETSVIAIVNDTALQSGLSTSGSRVINVDETNVDETNTSDDSALAPRSQNIAAAPARFGFLPALFRSFRDQHCAWQSVMFGADQEKLHYQACLVSMNVVRTRELSGALSMQRAIDLHGRSFRGYYVRTDSGAMFQPCERRTDWWLVGADAVMAALDRRYLDIKAQSTDGTDLLYGELRGEITGAPASGPGADYSAALRVRSVGLLRPVSDSDCAATLVSTQAASGSYMASADSQLITAQGSQASDSSSAATVDDYASSGFLYGYFNYWLAACAVTENSVCSAETEAQFASDGDWQLRIDRSLEGDWRVQLIPTTDNQVIEKQLSMQINGADVYLGTSFPEPMQLAMKQGVGVADGETARELIAKLRQGRELRFEWFDDADVMSELQFSLLGVTRALQYFDNQEP